MRLFTTAAFLLLTTFGIFAGAAPENHLRGNVQDDINTTLDQPSSLTVKPLNETRSRDYGRTPPTAPVPVNVALNKPTEQSSISAGGNASRAVDGNRNGRYHLGSVTHTTHERDPYWSVDLQSTYDIQNIKVFNRDDSCCRFRLADFKLTIFNAGNEVFEYNHSRTPAYETDIDVPPGIFGDKVKISLSGGGNSGGRTLSLAEVEVYSLLHTMAPTTSPSQQPSAVPSIAPTVSPSTSPSQHPSMVPSIIPTVSPSTSPSEQPSAVPTVTPTVSPSTSPSQQPSAVPSCFSHPLDGTFYFYDGPTRHCYELILSTASFSAMKQDAHGALGSSCNSELFSADYELGSSQSISFGVNTFTGGSPCGYGVVRESRVEIIPSVDVSVPEILVSEPSVCFYDVILKLPSCAV